MIKQFALTFCE